MQSLLDLHLLVDKYAEALPHLNLDGEKSVQKSSNRICGQCHKPGHRKENCPDTSTS